VRPLGKAKRSVVRPKVDEVHIGAPGVFGKADPPSADDDALAATKALAMSTAVLPGQRESEALAVANRMLRESAGAQRTVTFAAHALNGRQPVR
jgi:hypothetical protein